MIVVDTNVVSELMKQRPHGAVTTWYASAVPGELTLTATVVAELAYGVQTAPEGKRQTWLGEALEQYLAGPFDGRVLPFDADAARAYGALRAARRREGRPISMGDAQIAAVCAVRGATLATRNARDFEGLGIQLVNPWEG